MGCRVRVDGAGRSGKCSFQFEVAGYGKTIAYPPNQMFFIGQTSKDRRQGIVIVTCRRTTIGAGGRFLPFGDERRQMRSKIIRSGSDAFVCPLSIGGMKKVLQLFAERGCHPVQSVGLIHHPADERKRFVIEGVLLVNGLFIEPSHFVDHIAEIEDIKQHLFIVTFFKNIDLRLQLAGRRFLLHIADDVSVDLQSLRVEG